MKKYYTRLSWLAFIFVMSSLTHSATAQDIIDADFLDNIESNASFIYNEKIPSFVNNTVPDKWKNESAIIVDYSRSVMFDRTTKGILNRKERKLNFIEKVRFKIKLNDNNSVQNFSEIYFRYGSSEDGFIAKITKADGSKETVDLKNAVGIESYNDVPEYFQSFFDQVAGAQYQYYKVPISNLEPGDILEYVTTTKSILNVTSTGYLEFRPFYEVCNKNYPIMNNEIIIETDDKSFFKTLSLNGAPNFTKENSVEKDFFRYVFVDKDREKIKDVNFIKPFLQFPLVKFQVIYANNEDKKGALIGEKGELKTGFNIDELARKAWEDYERVDDNSIMSGDVSVKQFIKECWSTLKTLDKSQSWSEEDFINKSYYLIRNRILFKNQYISDKYFAYIFGSLLYQRDINSELVITISNSIGKFEQILFDSEIRYAIKIKDKYYFNVTDYSNPGELVESLLDNKAYILTKPEKKSKQPGVKEIKLPGTTSTDNLTDVAIKTQLSDDKKKLMVVRTTTYSGISKSRNIESALKYVYYYNYDYINFGGSDPQSKMSSQELKEYNKALADIKVQFIEKKQEYIKAQLEGEYDQKVSNVRFELLQEGRSLEKKNLSVKEGFELSDCVRKAGDKYLINLSGLIGSQLLIKNEERERTYDIDVSCPRSFNWTINFKIPDGYTLEGLNELTKKVENETGTFSIAGKLEEGNLILNITKVYKSKYIPKEQWKDMLSYIDAAYDTKFKYILLKPKQ